MQWRNLERDRTWSALAHWGLSCWSPSLPQPPHTRLGLQTWKLGMCMPKYRFLGTELLVWSTTPKCSKPESLVIAGLQLMQSTVCSFLPAVKQELFLSWMKSGHHGFSGKGVLKSWRGMQTAWSTSMFCLVGNGFWTILQCSSALQD